VRLYLPNIAHIRHLNCDSQFSNNFFMSDDLINIIEFRDNYCLYQNILRCVIPQCRCLKGETYHLLLPPI